MQKSPFKFLDSYNKDDRDIFFGRDKEIAELYSRVFENKILVIYGISGTGKSSLINCGLANKLNDADWLPINIRRSININQSLFDGLARAASNETVVSPVKKDIVKVIKSIYLDNFKPVYLIFDQFEELFIFGSSEEKDDFITNIKKIFESDLQCRIIFSIREEYLAGLSEFEKVIPSFLSNRIRIEKMTRNNAIKVIEGPCLFHNINVEPGFSAALLEKLNPDNQDVELTYLQVCLDKVFQLASSGNNESKKLTSDLLDKTGDVKDLLGSFLEEQTAMLDDPEAGLIILKSFVSIKGTRQQISENEIVSSSRALGKELENEKIRNLIQRFIKLRILRDKDENGKYELRHDSLASKIYEKITLFEKELLEIRQFIENAYTNFEKRRTYLTGEDLDYIAPFETRLFLNEKITRFISQSKSLLHKAKRRRQNVLISTAAVIISVLSFFTIWALKERGNAIKQQQFANVQKNDAITARIAADSSSREALISKNLALEKEKMAVAAQQQSEIARKEALTEREYAMTQKNRAEKLSITANESAIIANEEKLKAEQERAKAITSEQKATQLGLLSTAQNLALKTTNVEKNPELMGLLAVQAFVFNRNNGGKINDPIIWEALNNAWANLDNHQHSVFTGSPNEIWSLATKENDIISSDLDGLIRSWKSDGTNRILTSFTSPSPVSFITSSYNGNYIITQNDNFALTLHDIVTSVPVNLDGHKGFVRFSAFDTDGRYLATTGWDSMIIVWNIKDMPVSKVKTIKACSVVRSIVFAAGKIIWAEETGDILSTDIRDITNSILYTSKTEKILSFAYNQTKDVLLAGGSEGNLLYFDLSRKIPVTPGIYPVHSAGIDMITMSPDGSFLATASRDKTIRFYNYHDFFEAGNTVGGTVHLNDINQRIRSMIFTKDNKLVAGLSDKSIRLWETSSLKLSEAICSIVKRNMTPGEWKDMVGDQIPYEKTSDELYGKK